VDDDGRQLQGEIQMRIMNAVWRLGGGTVEEIRAAMPSGHDSAYTTTQTVLNRLAVRGLLERVPGSAPRGPTAKIVYRPLISEEDYLAGSIERTLAAATPEARRLAIARLIGRLDEGKSPAKRRRRKK
jgi:BlaI family transcriptional regulator, penicillinase repressor